MSPRWENDVPVNGIADKLLISEAEITKSPRVLCADTSQRRAARSAVDGSFRTGVAVLFESPGVVMVYGRCTKGAITLGALSDETPAS